MLKEVEDGAWLKSEVAAWLGLAEDDDVGSVCVEVLNKPETSL